VPRGIRSVRLWVILLGSLTAARVQAQSDQWAAPRPLPLPGGRYAVGQRMLQFTDSSRASSRSVRVRPLAVSVMYPTAQHAHGRTAYIADSAILDSMIAHHYLDLEPSDIRSWSRVGIVARPDAPALKPGARGGWPVLVLSHGSGVSRFQYTSLAQELASRGYVVIAIDHPGGGFLVNRDFGVIAFDPDSLPYETAPLKSAVRDWVADAVFVVRRLAALPADSSAAPFGLMIDTNRVGMIGHSLGGAAALQGCRSAPLIRACVDLDGYPFGEAETEGVTRPFLTLLSEPGGRREPVPTDSAAVEHARRFRQMGLERDSLWASIEARHPEVPSRVLKLVGTAHMTFSDAPFVAPTLLRGVGATVDAYVASRRVLRLVQSFFDRYLRPTGHRDSR
jgi:Predicted dienelactone hydrolase